MKRTLGVGVLALVLGIGVLGAQPQQQPAGRGRGAVPPPPPATHKLLFLTHAGLYKHTSLGPAEQAVKEMGTRNGFAVTTVEGYDADKLDFSFLTPDVVRAPRRHLGGGPGLRGSRQRWHSLGTRDGEVAGWWGR